MKTICPVTGNECPYDQRLDSGVCPREHECDIIKAEYSKMLKKPPSHRKYIFISLAVFLVLSIASVIYFFVFDGTLDFIKNNGVSETASATPSAAPTAMNTAQPTTEPTILPTPVPTALPAVPVTDSEPTSVARIELMGTIHEVRAVGLDRESKIRAYPEAGIVSWYEGSGLPGEYINSILFGFRYFGGVSGSFHSLENIKKGDRIGFVLDNGTVMELEAYEIHIYEKDNLPGEVFELESTIPHTVLITQHGEIDPMTRDYMNMLVVYLKKPIF